MDTTYTGTTRSACCGEEPKSSPDVDRAMRSIAHPRRREILCLLDERDEWAERDLVASLVEDAAGSEYPSRGAIETSLRHQHYPSLERAGLVSVDDDEGTVSRGEDFELAQAIIDAVDSVDT